MNRLVLLVIALLLGMTLIARFPCLAEAGQENAVLALHVAPHDGSIACEPWIPCSSFETQGLIQASYDVYLVVANGSPESCPWDWSCVDEGIAGVSCGISYDAQTGQGVDIFDWVFCGDLEFGNTGPNGDWPAAGSGNRLTWDPVDSCQRFVFPDSPSEGVHTIVGSFYVYAYDKDALAITTNNVLSGPELQVADCRAASYNLPLTAGGMASFSGSATDPGFNPCAEPDAPPPPPPPPPPREVVNMVLLHIGNVVASPEACTSAPENPRDVITSGEAADDGSARYFVYILGANKNPDEFNADMSGFQLAIDYTAGSGPADGLKVLDWQHCSDLEFPRDDWPEPGSGNTITWAVDTCQMEKIAVAGYFYVSAYTSSTMSIVPFPVTGVVKVANCRGEEQNLIPLQSSHVGWVSLGGGAIGSDTNGCNPVLESCTVLTPTQPVSWGRLKQMYTDGN
jgi:hypothetical protein